MFCFVILTLSGCAGVKVSTIDTEHYMEQRRGDVLTSGDLSSYTGSALQVLGLERNLCMEDGEPCRAALYSTSGLTEERRLSSLAELWLHEAVSREKKEEGKPVTGEDGQTYIIINVYPGDTARMIAERLYTNELVSVPLFTVISAPT